VKIIIYTIIVLWMVFDTKTNAYNPYQLLTQLRFEYITLEEGLSQNNVFAILQDRLGYLWFGTEDGLNRYDGYTCKIFRHNTDDSTSISDNTILSLFEDRDGTLWIGTKFGGLNKFDPISERFTRYQYNSQDSNSISSNQYLTSINQSMDGYLWIGTDNGLNRFNPKQEQFTRFFHWLNTEEGQDIDFVWCIEIDCDSNLWIGTNQGLKKYNPFTGKIEYFSTESPSSFHLNNNMVRSIQLDGKDSVWVATNDGLCLLDLKTGNSKLFNYLENKPSSLISNRIRKIYKDKQGLIWIATTNGLDLFDKQNSQFFHFNKNFNQFNTINNNFIYTIYQDPEQNIWLGTVGGGVNKFNFLNIKFIHYPFQAEVTNSLNDKDVLAIYEDQDQRIWLGTSQGGLNVLDRKTGKFSHYLTDEYHKNILRLNEIKSIKEDTQENLWLGSKQNGLIKFNKKSFAYEYWQNPIQTHNTYLLDEIWSMYLENDTTMWLGTGAGLRQVNLLNRENRLIPYSLIRDIRNSAYVICIVKDKEGFLWTGTFGGGLLRVNKNTGELTRYLNTPGDTLSISSNRVNSIFIDSADIFWLGTLGGGLNRFDPKTGVFQRFTIKNGLPNNDIFGIVPDDHGNLWLSTNKGVSRFNPRSNSFRNFDISDGLQSYQFSDGGYFKNTNGEIFFGGNNGFNIFHPDSISDNPHIPGITITELSIFGELRDLNTFLHNNKPLELNWQENYLELKFAALDYRFSKKNRYAYQLQGFDRDWIWSGTRNWAYYSNLEPGNYQFNVIGSNNDGVWNNQGISFKIVIHPPFWKTLWFKILTIITLLTGSYAWYRRRTHNLFVYQQLLERQVKERTAELNQKKNQLESKNIELQRINNIVKSINLELDFTNLLQSILDEFGIIPSIERASALALDKENHCYRLIANQANGKISHDTQRITDIEIEHQFKNNSTEIYSDLFYHTTRHFFPKSDTEIDNLTPGSFLCLKLSAKDSIEGWLIFENLHQSEAFNSTDIELIINLKEHILSAFIKAKILAELKELNEKKNQFLGIAAHDLRNPLTGIRGYLQLFIYTLKMDNFDRIKSVDDLNRALKIVDRMSNLINNLLDISAIESGKIKLTPEKVEIQKLLEEVIQFYHRLAEQKQIRLTLHENTQAQFAVIDRSRIIEVIDNLISNALKYTYPEGSVEVWYQQTIDQVTIFVRDTGQGLSQEDIQQLFSSFTRLSAKPTGGECSTGLGLAIVKKIVELHGGTVSVESQLNVGSTFSFSLPISPYLITENQTSGARHE